MDQSIFVQNFVALGSALSRWKDREEELLRLILAGPTEAAPVEAVAEAAPVEAVAEAAPVEAAPERSGVTHSAPDDEVRAS